MKKMASLLLAAVLAVGMAVTGYAANDKITAQLQAFPDQDVDERNPGYEIWIPFSAADFEPGTLADPITSQDVKTSKIAVKQSIKSGSKAIDTIEIKADSSKVANVVITLKDPFASVDAVDFDVRFYLTIDGKRQDLETQVTGTLKNEETEVYSGYDYVDLSGGQVAVCEETVKKIEVDLGNGVSVFVNMQKGKSYYGIATNSPDDTDDGILSEYPDIANVFHLTTIGLNASGNIVKIDTSGTEFHAYDADLKYLGKTSEMLPYSTKYYLAEEELSITGTDEPGDEPDDEPIDEELLGEGGEGTTGSGTTSGNPGTGVSPMLGIAIALGAGSLLVMGVFTKKKNKV